MSTVVGEQGSLSTVPVASILDRRGSLAAFAVGGLLAAVGGGILLATSNHLVDPTAYGVQVVVTIVGAVSAALYWLVRRPGNRLGLLLLAFAVAATGLSLQGATQPLLHSIGVLADSAFFFLLYYVVFAFPEGRIASRLEWSLLGALALYFLTTFFPWFFFSPVVYGGSPLALCNSACPANGLMIADRPTIADGFFHISPISLSDVSYYLIVLSSAILVYLIYRLATGTRPRRRALLPVYVPALMVTASILVFYGVVADLLHLDSSTVRKVGWLLTIGYAALPYGFLLSIVASAFFAATALKGIVGRLGENPNASQLQTILGDALDDPSLELAFNVKHTGEVGDPGSGLFVDSRGDSIDPTLARDGRSATALQRRGGTVAYILHDAALETDPELVQAAGHSVLLALESGRLEAELQSRTAELLASRGRIVAASEVERRKIERDLHDGAQQRLMAIQVKVEVLRSRIDDRDVASALEELADDATAAVDDLRGLAHGIYPTVLRERGLVDALRSAARTAAIDVNVIDPGIDRCAPAVEAAVYFCSIEAIQNAVKHAGLGAHLRIALGRRGDDVLFAFVDDGVGFDPDEQTDGVGLESIRDRIGAVGGEVEITSTPGGGTAIRGHVPRAAHS